MTPASKSASPTVRPLLRRVRVRCAFAQLEGLLALQAELCDGRRQGAGLRRIKAQTVDEQRVSGCDLQAGAGEDGGGVAVQGAQDMCRTVDVQQDAAGAADPHLLAAAQQAGGPRLDEVACVQRDRLFAQQLADQAGRGCATVAFGRQ